MFFFILWNIISIYSYDLNSDFFTWLIDLFDRKPNGLWAILEDECKAKKSSSTICIKKVLSISHQNFCLPKISTESNSDSCFVVRHFAQDVKYTAVRIQIYFEIFKEFITIVNICTFHYIIGTFRWKKHRSPL